MNSVELDSDDGKVVQGIEAVNNSSETVIYTMYENTKIRDQRDKTDLNDNNGNAIAGFEGKRCRY